jgi:hypothetical protein
VLLHDGAPVKLAANEVFYWARVPRRQLCGRGHGRNTATHGLPEVERGEVLVDMLVDIR